jgi:hypothetical protein
LTNRGVYFNYSVWIFGEDHDQEPGDKFGFIFDLEVKSKKCYKIGDPREFLLSQAEKRGSWRNQKGGGDNA